MDLKNVRIYTASSATVAISAESGKLADPRSIIGKGGEITGA